MKTLFNLPYSKNYQEIRTIDWFIPEEVDMNQRCILFIHGGGWQNGDKKSWHEVAKHFCLKGFVCASINYRLAPNCKFPGQVEDVRIAMDYVKRQSERYGFCKDSVSVCGSSAGAHLAAMLATIFPDDDIGLDEEISSKNTLPESAILYCPAMTVRIWEGASDNVIRIIHNFMGKKEEEDFELYLAASPYERITGKEPPFLFLHGDADEVIPVKQSIDSYNRIIEKGGQAKIIILRGVKHGFGYGVKTEAQKEAIKHVEKFLGV